MMKRHPMLRCKNCGKAIVRTWIGMLDGFYYYHYKQSPFGKCRDAEPKEGKL